MNLYQEVKSEVHPKQWGEEIWRVNNSKYCCKELVFEPLHRTSIHKHKAKSEVFFMTEGDVYVEFFSDRSAVEGMPDSVVHFVSPDVGIEVEPGVWHRITGGVEGGTLLEFSTHHDENDVSRASGSGECTDCAWDDLLSFPSKDI